MNSKLTDDERIQLITGTHSAELLPKYQVESANVRFCESRGISPVIFYAFCNIDVGDSENRHVREIIEDPKPDYIKQVRDILIALRAQQNIIIPGALQTYFLYLEKMKHKSLSKLLGDL